MAVTKTTSASLNTNKSLNSFLARGGGFDTGTIAFDSSYISNGGESLTFFNNTKGVFIQPKGGYVFDYDITNSKVIVYYGNYDLGSDGVLIEVPTGTDLLGLSAVPYFAVGWD